MIRRAAAVACLFSMFAWFELFATDATRRRMFGAAVLIMLLLWGAVELGWGGGDPSKSENRRR